MTEQETTAVMAILKVAYPTFYKDGDTEQAILLWAEMFDCEPFDLVRQAVKALISVNKFPPTIADVKDKIRFLTEPKQLSEMEAWDKVRAAASNSVYNSEREFDKLPPAIQRVIGSHNQLREWAMMDSDTFNSVVQSNFMRSFKTVQKQEKEYEALPESAKAMLDGKFMLEGGQ